MVPDHHPVTSCRTELGLVHAGQFLKQLIEGPAIGRSMHHGERLGDETRKGTQYAQRASLPSIPSATPHAQRQKLGSCGSPPLPRMGRGVFHPRPHMDPLRPWMNDAERGKPVAPTPPPSPRRLHEPSGRNPCRIPAFGGDRSVR